MESIGETTVSQRLAVSAVNGRPLARLVYFSCVLRRRYYGRSHFPGGRIFVPSSLRNGRSVTGFCHRVLVTGFSRAGHRVKGSSFVSKIRILGVAGGRISQFSPKRPHSIPCHLYLRSGEWAGKPL
jgi:hypothetical protein